MPFHHRILPNGLTVIAESDPAAHTTAIGVFVRAGARDETGQFMGVSHFLEHMCFKGTDTINADQLNQAFDDLGLSNNAYTSHEETVYYAHGLPEHLDQATSLLLTMMRPALRQEDFELEKKVILEEIAMYNDRPYWRLQDRLGELFYGTHGLGHRVLGTHDTVSALTAEQMRHYFQTHYAPGRMIIAAAGQLDFDRWTDAIQAATASWTTTPTTTPTTATPAPASSSDANSPASISRTCPKVFAADQTVIDPSLHQAYLAFTWEGPSHQDHHHTHHHAHHTHQTTSKPTKYAAAIMTELLGDSESSRLYWSLIDPGLAEEASLGHQPLDGTGQYLAYLACAPEKAAEAEAVFRKTLTDLAENLATVSDDELNRTKMKLATTRSLEAERPAGRMHRLGEQWLNQDPQNTQYTPAEAETAALMAVTQDDIIACAQAFTQTPTACLRLTPFPPLPEDPTCSPSEAEDQASAKTKA